MNWKESVRLTPDWAFEGNVLWHRLALGRAITKGSTYSWRNKLIAFIYADQNRSRKVKAEIHRLISELSDDCLAINIGAGRTRFPRMVNLDVGYVEGINIVGFGSELPFKTESVSLVLMQEVLEHVDVFQDLLNEVYRVLKPGGKIYCQVPFQIGFHPGPSDYWRFSRQALEFLFKLPEWQIEKLETSLGHGSGFYRIAVEFLAVTASCVHHKIYIPVKALAAILLYPFKIFDLVTDRSPEKDRIPGGYFCVAIKKNNK